MADQRDNRGDRDRDQQRDGARSRGGEREKIPRVGTVAVFCDVREDGSVWMRISSKRENEDWDNVANVNLKDTAEVTEKLRALALIVGGAAEDMVRK